MLKDLTRTWLLCGVAWVLVGVGIFIIARISLDLIAG